MIELWGGPVYVRGANISKEECDELNACTRIINWGEVLEGDDGPIFRHELAFAGLPVWACQRYGTEAHFQLFEGGWIVVERGGLHLALEARALGLPVIDYTRGGDVPILGLRIIAERVFIIENGEE
jgi:hypothetical protein